jgi:hypothetical protein
VPASAGGLPGIPSAGVANKASLFAIAHVCPRGPGSGAHLQPASCIHEPSPNKRQLLEGFESRNAIRNRAEFLPILNRPFYIFLGVFGPYQGAIVHGTSPCWRVLPPLCIPGIGAVAGPTHGHATGCWGHRTINVGDVAEMALRCR